MSERRPTVVFFPEGAYGPTNNCVGIAQVLAERGVRVVFVVEESFAGTLESQGFEEALMRLAPAPEVPEEPGQFWKDFIRDTAPEFRKPTIEQLETFLLPTWTALVDGSRYVNDRLAEIFDDLRPDAIVEDNVVWFPAVAASGRPWARIVSCNPLEMGDPALPPVFSGYATDDPTGWEEFRAEFRRTHGDLWSGFAAFVEANGSPPLPDHEFMVESPFLNLFLYPEEADYRRSAPLGPTWHRLDACVRRPAAEFELPDGLRGDGALVYFSLGSLGSADVGLMDRLIAILAETPHRYVVSKGPQAGQIELADNMWGEEFVPQPAILPRVDLVITHGGNNTVTESLHHGLPMVVLPLFWDQYDNAQRMDELGFGRRLDPWTCEPGELSGAIDGLLSDAAARDRLARAGERIRANPGTHRAADLIERLARTGQSVPRHAN
ncbi:MAG TPA: nucleotide disphospho-sugar-binding domain-containing protein, partial [Actinomycetota bacterium]|nr:nucleotide disphospho-sugar-binding domain-containing protein [Actinomycetota bacterium]